MIHLKWIKSRKVRNIKNSLPLIIIKVDITYITSITSHNVYYVNSKEGEVMEKSDLIKIKHAIEVVEDYILSYVDCDFDNEFYDVLLLSLKVAYYDMMRCS